MRRVVIRNKTESVELEDFYWREWVVTDGLEEPLRRLLQFKYRILYAGQEVLR